MSKYRLADVLGKFVWEVEQMPSSEYTGWVAYFNIKEKERKRQQAKNNNTMGGSQKERSFGGR